ncbi:MAG: LamB/YcsF family protein [Hyphomicrobiales bacterium]
MRRVDLNADLGESFGAYTMGNDEEMLKIITSANVACGFHGGDPLVMRKTLEMAKQNGVGVGAHPSLLDLWGFGRRAIQGESPGDVESILVYQIGAIQAMARALGMGVSHFKAHGALGNAAAVDAELAMACARAVKAADPNMLFLVMPGNEMEKAAAATGLRPVREVYADRAYDDDANLVSRKIEGAVIHDPQVAAQRVVRMVKEQAVTSISGRKIPVAFETVCVHGDNPSAVELSRSVRDALTQAGVSIRPMTEFAS